MSETTTARSLVLDEPAPLPKPVRKTTEQPKLRARSAAVPLMTELKVKNLYLVQALSYSQIATATGLAPWQVNGLIQRRKWAQERKRREERLRARADARTEEQLDSVQDAIASECEEIVFNGLVRAREATQSDSVYAAKDFQAWAGGVRSLAQVARSARGMDNADTKPTGQVNVFLTRGERVERDLKPVVELNPPSTT